MSERVGLRRRDFEDLVVAAAQHYPLAILHTHLMCFREHASELNLTLLYKAFILGFREEWFVRHFLELFKGGVLLEYVFGNSFTFLGRSNALSSSSKKGLN